MTPIKGFAIVSAVFWLVAACEPVVWAEEVARSMRAFQEDLFGDGNELV